MAGWVRRRTARVWRRQPLDERREVLGGLDRGRGAGRDDRLGVLPRGRLLAVLAEQRGELVGRQRREQLGRRHAARGVEAHVQRAAGPEPEAARAVGELERREPEVEQHPVDGAEARGRARRSASSRKFERRSTSRSPNRVEPLADPLDRGLVGVEPEDAAVRVGGLQDPLGVPTAADRGVDLEAAGARGQGPEDLVRHHRQVPFLHLSSIGRLRIPSGPWKRMWCDVRSPGRRSASVNASGPPAPGCTSSQRAGAQISAWSRAPRTSASVSSPAKVRRFGRDEDATLAVELRLEGTREQLPLEQSGVRVGHGQAADLRRQLVPCRHRKDREAGVEPPRHDARSRRAARGSATGTARRPLSSTACRYSPVNTDPLLPDVG